MHSKMVMQEMVGLAKGSCTDSNFPSVCSLKKWRWKAQKEKQRNRNASSR